MLVPEYLLAGHLIDRAGMPHVIGAFGRDVMRDIAIEEWMGASPVYTQRMQRALGFEGDSVETIFKGMQIDVGAPPSSWTSATGWPITITASSGWTTAGP